MITINIIDYIKKHQNETFKDYHFTEVDNLILSLLPYIDFTDIVPAFKKNKITLKEAVAKLENKKFHNRDFFAHNTKKMLNIMSTTKRYGDAYLYNYMKVVNNAMQFGALTIKLNDKTIFISYAGTDTSIIGWEENFKLSYLYPSASQKYAAIYLNKAVGLLDKNILIGGHSKGGNLAICAAMNTKWYIKTRLKAIYNNDGPGFLKEQIESSSYKKIAAKIKMYVPEESIIGMILYHVDNYTVVKARSFNIFQHDAFNWQCSESSFITSKLNKRSKKLEKRLTEKLEKLSLEERLKLVQNLFLIFKNNNIKDAKDFKITKIFKLIKSFQKLDKQTQNLLIEFLILIFIK